MLATACPRGNLCTLFKSSQNTDSFIKDFPIKSSVLPILEKMTLYKFEIIRYVYFYNNYNNLQKICRYFMGTKEARER